MHNLIFISRVDENHVEPLTVMVWTGPDAIDAQASRSDEDEQNGDQWGAVAGFEANIRQQIQAWGEKLKKYVWQHRPGHWSHAVFKESISHVHGVKENEAKKSGDWGACTPSKPAQAVRKSVPLMDASAANLLEPMYSGLVVSMKHRSLGWQTLLWHHLLYTLAIHLYGLCTSEAKRRTPESTWCGSRRGVSRGDEAILLYQPQLHQVGSHRLPMEVNWSQICKMDTGTMHLPWCYSCLLPGVW